MLLCVALSSCAVVDERTFTNDACDRSYRQLRDTSLQLGWQKFDQTMGEHWRRLAKEGCPLEAARLIDEFLARHTDSVQDFERRVSSWHAGQMFATAGDSATAIDRMKRSLDDDPPSSGARFHWNEYARATIAFLQSDLATFEREAATVERSEHSGDKMNARVLARLRANWGKPYRDAY